MTAVTLVAGASSSYLLADGGCYGDDGTILHIRTKIDVSDRLRVAIAHSGLLSETFQLEHWLSELPDQSAMLRSLPEKLRREMREIEASKDAYPEDFAAFANTPVMAHLFVALWSHEHEEPQAYVIASPGHKFGPSYVPYTVARVSGVEQPGVNPKFRPPFKAKNARWALPVIKQQRCTPAEDGVSRVAGFAELVTVGSAGIERRIIHRWRSDKIGRKVTI